MQPPATESKCHWYSRISILWSYLWGVNNNRWECWTKKAFGGFWLGLVDFSTRTCGPSQASACLWYRATLSEICNFVQRTGIQQQLLVLYSVKSMESTKWLSFISEGKVHTQITMSFQKSRHLPVVSRKTNGYRPKRLASFLFTFLPAPDKLLKSRFNSTGCIWYERHVYLMEQWKYWNQGALTRES